MATLTRRERLVRLGYLGLATGALATYFSLAQPPVIADARNFGCPSNNCNMGASCGDTCHCDFPACYTNS